MMPMRRSATLAVAAGIALAALAAGCNGEGGKPLVRPVSADSAVLRSPGGTFSVYVEQNGRLVAMSDHTVRVKKAPFTLVLVFPALRGVLVNCSDQPGLFDQARTGGAVTKMPPLGRQIEEAAGNPHHQVVLTEEAWHHWYIFADSAHKFESVTHKDDKYFCRRTVGTYLRPGAERGGIEQFEGNTLYFVFVKPAWSGSERIEQDREYLKIVFE